VDVTSDGWLGLRRGPDDGSWSFDIAKNLSRFDGKFYGGTGIAVSTALVEAATDRDALWVTTQFVGTAEVGDRIDCHVDRLAHGRRTSQVRVTAAHGERLVFVALGSAGLPRAAALEVQIPTMPEVAPPDDSPPWNVRAPLTLPEGDRGWIDLVDLREVPDLGAAAGSGMAVWARMRDGVPHSRATIGFVADLVPTSVVRAGGRAGAGTSLDNSMRFGAAPDTEWVLVEFVPQLATAGYLHGLARVWSSDGVLLGLAGQTAVSVLFD
jgi:acyl-CoA thioesterase